MCVVRAWSYIYFSLSFFCLLLLLLLLLLPYHVVCITQCLKLSSSLCGSHGTIAIAQQVCVDHVHAYVDIAYTCVCDGCVCYDAMIPEACVACASTAVVMFKVNNTRSTQQKFLLLVLLFSSSNNVAAHASCFLQHKL